MDDRARAIDVGAIRAASSAAFRPAEPRAPVACWVLGAAAPASLLLCRHGASSEFFGRQLPRRHRQAGRDRRPDAAAQSRRLGACPALSRCRWCETLAIAFLGTLAAAILAVPLGFWPPATSRPSGVLHFLSRRIARHHPQHRHADLGADLDQRGRTWPFAGVLAIMTSDIGSFRQAVLRGDRGRRPAGRSKASSRPAAGGVLGIRFGILPRGASRYLRARCCTSSNPTPARPPSSASSAPAASACSRRGDPRARAAAGRRSSS